MHLCEPFLSGAPYAYFGALCTPVEERWLRQSNVEKTEMKHASCKW